MAKIPALSAIKPVARSILLALAFLVILVLLMMWLLGAWEEKIGESPGTQPAGQVAGRPVGDAELAEVQAIEVPVIETAVGTVRPVHETTVASKVLAKITAVHVRAGQRVKKDDVLVELDDEDLVSRKNQAQAAVDAAKSRFEQSRIEYERVQNLFERNAASQIELDRVTSEYKSSRAELEQARQALKEAETILSYATIRAPINGIVVDKKVEEGDTVTPGQPLLVLYDPDRMQLVAGVRESLARELKEGQSIDVRVDALEFTCAGTISEIVPEAEAASRTFAVKVTGPCPPGVYAGMFGRMFIPRGHERVLVVPQRSIRRVGQLTTVRVAEGDLLHTRAVQLGEPIDEENIQVLSGLREGEKVALLSSPDRVPGTTG